MSTSWTSLLHARHVGVRRLIGVTALVGAALLATPLIAAAPIAPVHHHHWAGKTAAEARETVEDRIKTLHEQLGITAAEETQWGPVAQAMRDNEADMQRLITERRNEPAHMITAVEDLKTYEHFTQAHVNGLKNLISSFETLYGAMPPAQQATADQVFKTFGHRAGPQKS